MDSFNASYFWENANSINIASQTKFLTDKLRQGNLHTQKDEKKKKNIPKLSTKLKSDNAQSLGILNIEDTKILERAKKNSENQSMVLQFA